MSFQDDIKGRNTQLYPIVTIEPVSITAGQLLNPFENSIFLSTNNISLSHPPVGNSYIAQEDVKNPYYFKPLLLNIPSIKESIDIESRKFKISNVSLDISNIEYEGKRFTDILSDTSLINWKCSIQFVSPSVELFSTILNVGYIDGVTDTSFYEAYTKPVSESSGDYADQSIRDKMTQMVYQGIIRRISHDDTKCKIELEDLTEKKAHKDLPQKEDQNGVVGYLGGSNSILDKYKNKPIPMVYGHVDRSPVVIKLNKLLIDSKDISGIIDSQNDSTFINEKRYSVLINIDNIYISVPNIIEEALESDYSIETQWIEDSPNSIQLQSTDLFLLERLQCRHYGFPSSLSFIHQIEDEGYISDSPNHLDGFEDIVADGNLETFVTVSLDNNIGGVANAFNNAMMLCYRLIYDTNPPFDYESIGVVKLSLNGYRMPTRSMILGESVDAISYAFPTETDLSSVDLDGNGDTEDLSQLFRFTGSYDVSDPADTSQDIHFGGAATSSVDGAAWAVSGLFYFVGEGTGTSCVFYGVPAATYEDDFTSASCQIEAKIRESSTTLLADIKKPLTKNFYANVKGRINTFDDHLDNPVDYIENPIDIIYDLVRSELGHDAINEAEYLEAKAAHKYLDSNNIEQDWKFGFTINKKINSKKLIEEIAKSTKCFPKFKNDGTFGFNTIKDYYNAADISSATPIKESEVISYSFKKTKPEQIYKKVTVSYNKDYAQDSYLKTALSADLLDDPYYGIEDSSDAHLEFESDYIRDKVTADKLASFLLEQYKNNHLLFNLKLPLQYINLDIGSIVKFQTLFDKVKPYGINYTIYHMVNGQYRLPVFMITSITKNLNSVSIECMQLHDSGEQHQAELDEQAAADAAASAEEAIIMQPPVITIANGNQTVQAGDVFTLPTATAIDVVDGAITVITSYSDSVDFINISDDGTAIASDLGLNTSIQVQFEATDSSNVTAYASTSIHIVQHPSYSIFDTSVFDGYRTFAINEFHYGGEPETDISGFGNAFWFLFYHNVDAITGNNFFQDTNYNEYVGGREIFKILQVSGLNPSDNGLYFLAAEFVSADDSGAFRDDLFGWQYASANDPNGDGTNYISVYPNHQLCFQKINMTQNVYNPVTNNIETTIIGDYSNPVVGAWLTEPVVDNTHTMQNNIFQDNVGAFFEGQMINPETITADEHQGWISPYVYPELSGGTPAAPLIIGGYQDMSSTGYNDFMPDQFVGGISMSETTSIELIDIPTEPIYNPEGILGDSNTDGYLNILDIVGTVNFIITYGNSGGLSDEGIVLADYNQDGFLNILDIVGLVNHILEVE